MKGKNQFKVSETIRLNTPPAEMHDVEIEKAVLGSVLLEREALNKFLLTVTPELFSDSKNQIIAQSILEMHANGIGIDIATVTSYLRKYLLLEKAGGAYYVTMLTININSAENFDSHALFLTELYTRRELYRSFIQWATNMVNQDIFSLLTAVNNKLLEFNVKMSPKTVPSVFVNKLNYILELDRVMSGDKSFYLTTGFRIDQIITGLGKGELIVIAARPGMGKTTIAMNISSNVAAYGFKVGIINLEMSEFDITSRFLASNTGIEFKKIKKGDLDRQERIRIENHLCSECSKNLLIDSTGNSTIEHIRAKIHLMHFRDGVRLVVIDYLTLIRKLNTNNQPKDQIIDDIVRDIKLISKELGITTILLSQVNRSVDSRPDKMPTLADCHGTMGIEAHADIVAFMLKPSYYGIDQDENGQPIPEGMTFFNVKKNRGGDTGTVRLDYQGEIYKFRDYAMF